MANRNRFTATVSMSAFAVSLAAMATPAVAQDVDPNVDVEADADAQSDDVIIVSGFRESLATSVSTKRNSDLILESVTAEDIGKLPDDSIGESIARLPGVTSQRLNGRANVIAIRGLGPDFSQTLLNGREQTSTGDNRAVEFDQYPSEVVNQVNVYKTPSARASSGRSMCAPSVRSRQTNVSWLSVRRGPMPIWARSMPGRRNSATV